MVLKVEYAWKGNLLKLMNTGMPLTQAASMTGVAGHILAQEMNMDADFRAKIEGFQVQ